MPTEIPILTPHQIKSALETGVLLIDLRPYDAFASGHIPRSINVTFSRKSLPERIATAIPPGPSIILFSDKTTVAEAPPTPCTGYIEILFRVSSQRGSTRGAPRGFRLLHCHEYPPPRSGNDYTLPAKSWW